MPAQTPQDIHVRFVEAYNSGSADQLLGLYEEKAAFVTPDGAVQGHAAIRPILEGFLAMKGKLDLKTRSIVAGGDIALLSCSWSLDGVGADGNAIQLKGTSSEVARRQSDGTWLYVIDDPGAGK